MNQAVSMGLDCLFSVCEYSLLPQGGFISFQELQCLRRSTWIDIYASRYSIRYLDDQIRNRTEDTATELPIPL